MLQVRENVDISGMTTFRLPATIRYFTIVKTIEDIREAYDFAEGKGLSVVVLGGGSNVVFKVNNILQNRDCRIFYRFRRCQQYNDPDRRRRIVGQRSGAKRRSRTLGHRSHVGDPRLCWRHADTECRRIRAGNKRYSCRTGSV